MINILDKLSKAQLSSIATFISLTTLNTLQKSPYLVEIGEEDDFLDVPKEFASTERYVASTGHKVNHKRESNGRFEECLHPRFGWIHCFISNRVSEHGWKQLWIVGRT